MSSSAGVQLRGLVIRDAYFSHLRQHAVQVFFESSRVLHKVVGDNALNVLLVVSESFNRKIQLISLQLELLMLFPEYLGPQFSLKAKHGLLEQNEKTACAV